MPLRAKDIMHKQVVTVDPQMPLPSVMALFIERHITGAPVMKDACPRAPAEGALMTTGRGASEA